MAWRTAFGWCLLGQDGADFKPEVWTAAFDVINVDEEVHDDNNVDEEMHDAIYVDENEDVEADVEDVPMGAPSEEALKKLVNGISSGSEEGGHGVVEIASESRGLLETISEEREGKGSEELNGELEKVLDHVVDDFRVLAGEKSGGGRMPEKLTRRHVLELQVALLGAKMATQITQETSISVPKKWFYTDSLITFFCPQNKTENYPVSVANRINHFPLSLKLRKDEEEWPSLPPSYATVGAAVMEADKDAAEADPPVVGQQEVCLLYTSPSPRDATLSRMPSSA